jgi:hypothetical protein
VILQHIPREHNEEANRLAQSAAGYRENLEVFAEDMCAFGSDLAEDDWRKEIVDYLENPSRKVSRKLRYKAIKFGLLDGRLFYKSLDGVFRVQVDYNVVHLRTSLVQLFVLLLQNFEKLVQMIELKRFGGAPNGHLFATLGVLLQCLGQEEAKKMMSEVHDGLCGAHQLSYRMKWVIRHTGCYWPMMLEDCFKYYKGCQDCQKFGNIQKSPSISFESYYQAMDIQRMGYRFDCPNKSSI